MVPKFCSLARNFALVQVALSAPSHSQTFIPPAITNPAPNAYILKWIAQSNRHYQLQNSLNLQSWIDVGPVIVGSGSERTIDIMSTESRALYRFRNPVIRPGFNQGFLEGKDDNSSENLINLGFTINLFGTTRTSCWVNNNGNITLDYKLSNYTPEPLQAVGYQMIAPFWADFDTTPANPDPEVNPNPIPAGGVTTFGTGLVGGRPAFAVNWQNIGYYRSKRDKVNDLQLVLIERNDTGQANFDIEFNYAAVLWEAGDASSGTDGYGGYPGRVGITDGLGQSLEIQYSGESISQLDTNPITNIVNEATGLIYRSRNSAVPGRQVFQVRSGLLLGALNVYAGEDYEFTPGQTTHLMNGTASDPTGGAVSVKWSVFSAPDGPSSVTISNPFILNPIVSIPEATTVRLLLTATRLNDPSISATDLVYLFNATD